MWRFCAGLGEPAPAIRLRLVVHLRAALDEVTDAALDAGMAAAKAKAEGWGLQQIGSRVGLSHEKVRCRLAQRVGRDEPPGEMSWIAVEAVSRLAVERSWPPWTSWGRAKL